MSDSVYARLIGLSWCDSLYDMYQHCLFFILALCHAFHPRISDSLYACLVVSIVFYHDALPCSLYALKRNLILMLRLFVVVSVGRGSLRVGVLWHVSDSVYVLGSLWASWFYHDMFTLLWLIAWYVSVNSVISDSLYACLIDSVYADMFLIISTERERGSSACSADLVSAFCDMYQTRCMPRCMLALCILVVWYVSGGVLSLSPACIVGVSTERAVHAAQTRVVWHVTQHVSCLGALPSFVSTVLVRCIMPVSRGCLGIVSCFSMLVLFFATRYLSVVSVRLCLCQTSCAFLLNPLQLQYLRLILWYVSCSDSL